MSKNIYRVQVFFTVDAPFGKGGSKAEYDYNDIDEAAKEAYDIVRKGAWVHLDECSAIIPLQYIRGIRIETVEEEK